MDNRCSNCKTQIPQVLCHCQDPPLIFCQACLASHIVSQISIRHSTQQIVHQQPPLQKLIKCSVCDNHPAQIICLCKGSKTHLCHGCIPFHMNKHPRSPHPLQQLQADELIGQTNNSLLNYLQRKQVVDYLVGQARINLINLTKFQQQTILAHQKVEEFVHQNLQSRLSQIKEIEIYVQKMINHLQSARYEVQLTDSDWAHVLVKKANPTNLPLVSQELDMLRSEINLEQAVEAVRNIAVLQIHRDPSKKTPSIPYFKAKKQEMFLYETSTFSAHKYTIPGLDMRQVAG